MAPIIKVRTALHNQKVTEDEFTLQSPKRDETKAVPSTYKEQKGKEVGAGYQTSPTISSLKNLKYIYFQP